MITSKVESECPCDSPIIAERKTIVKHRTTTLRTRFKRTEYPNVVGIFRQGKATFSHQSYTEFGLKLPGLDLASLAAQGVGAGAQPNAYTGYGISGERKDPDTQNRRK